MNYFTSKDVAIERGLTVKDFSYERGFIVKEFADSRNVVRNDILWIENAINSSDIQDTINHFEANAKFYDVGVQGLPSNTEVGSRRITVYDEGFAKFLTDRLHHSLTPQIMNPYSRVDWISDNPEMLNYWVPLGISTAFRYMRYRNGSQHYVHYDAPFKTPNDPLTRTLKSGVLYLTDSYSCGTGFVNDGQSLIPFVNRNHDDWERPANDHEIYQWRPSRADNVLLFDHQLPHYVSEHKEDTDRIIIRFDVMYKAIGKI